MGRFLLVTVLFVVMGGGCAARYIPKITQGMATADAEAELKKGNPPAMPVEVTKLPDGTIRETYKQGYGDVKSYIIIEWGDKDVKKVVYTAF